MKTREGEMRSASTGQDMHCRLCGAGADPLARIKVLQGHDVLFMQCRECDLVQSERPWWLTEAYQAPINALDTGAVDRVLQLASSTCALVTFAFDRNARYLDFGGGHGLFVRRMRDLGFDFRWCDRYCTNLFAQGFEARADETGFALTTCFEVFEHLEEPGKELECLLSRTEALFFSTRLRPATGDLRSWDYLGQEHGQHIALFSLRTLEWIAKRYDVTLQTDGCGLHLLSRRSLPAWVFAVAVRPRLARYVGTLLPRRSLTLQDQAVMRTRMTSGR